MVINKNVIFKKNQYADKSVRKAKVLDRQYRRTTTHIDQFVQIKVTLSSPKNVSFVVIVRRDQSIEYLAKQVEAEFTLRYLFSPPVFDELPDTFLKDTSNNSFNTIDLNKKQSDNSIELSSYFYLPNNNSNLIQTQVDNTNSFDKPTQNDNNQLSDNTDSASKPPVYNPLRPRSVSYGASHKISFVSVKNRSNVSSKSLCSDNNPASQPPTFHPLVVGQIYGIDTLPLKFTDKVGDVFVGPAGSVYVINEYVENSSHESNPIESNKRLSIVSRKDVLPENSVVENVEEGFEAENEDDEFEKFMTNKYNIAFFALSCIETFNIENLLFWLDVEILQTTSVECRDRYARYIYLTYLQQSAPLAVNISEEVRNDVPYPPTYLKDKPSELDLTIYDEAQKKVLTILKVNSYNRFLQSPLHNRLLQFKAANPEQFENDDSENEFSNIFPISYSIINEVVGLFDGVDSNKIRKRIRDTAYKTASNQRRGNISDESIRTAIQEHILTLICSRFAASITKSFDNSRIKGYFSKVKRTNAVSRQRRRLKEKKIAKFFGEKPTSDILEKQVYSYDVVAVASVLDERPSIEFLEKQLFTSDGIIEDENESRNSSRRSSVVYALSRDKPNNNTRRRRKEKLEYFFGDILPPQQSENQKLFVDDINNSNDANSSLELSNVDSMKRPPKAETLPAPLTTNAISKAQRRMLQRRARKVSSILGQQIDEETVLKMTSMSHKTSVPFINRSSVSENQQSAISEETEISFAESNTEKELPIEPLIRRISASQGSGKPIGMRSRVSSSRISRDSLRLSSEQAPVSKEAQPDSNDNYAVTRRLYKKKLDKVSYILGERIKVEWLVDGVLDNGRESAIQEAPQIERSLPPLDKGTINSK